MAATANRPSRYQTFVLDFLLLAGLAARARGEDFAPVYWRRVEVMIDFLASMTNVAGGLPMIGDADDGRVVESRDRAGFLDAHFADRHRRGAVRARRPRRQGGRARRQDRHLVRRRGRSPAGQLKQRARHGFRPRLQFSESGYYLMGSGFDTPDEVRLLVDAGPLGYLSIAAHGHADALSFVLNIGDREILVDPGTYAYHTDPAWRRYFRSTLAHNTVGVDEQDQSVQAGNFMWTDHAQARCIEFETGTDRQRFVGEHYGYQRLEDPVVHRREIVCDTRRQVIEVTDMLRCDGEHRVRRSWHFAEDCQVERAGSGLKVTSGLTQVFFEPLEELDSMQLIARRKRRAGRLGIAQFRVQAAEYQRALVFARQRGHRAAHTHHLHEVARPLASEPAISEVELHQVVTADSPSGERTHVLAPRRLLRTLQRDR